MRSGSPRTPPTSSARPALPRTCRRTRKGWELVIEKLSELDEDATTEEVQAAQNLSEEEQKYSDALAQYVASKCADAMAGAMGGAS